MSLHDIKPGETIVYHLGYLPNDCYGDARLVAIANEAERLSREGKVFLTQRRHGFLRYEYRATGAQGE